MHALEDEYRISFYVDSLAEVADRALNLVNEKVKGALSFRAPVNDTPYKLVKTQRMVRETYAVPQEMILSNKKTDFYGGFLDRDSSSVNWFHEDLRKEKLGDGF